MNKLLKIFLFAGIACLFNSCNGKPELRTIFDWPNLERTWVGPDFWANRLQDWQLSDGRLICNYSGPNRNLYILSREFNPDMGDIHLSIPFKWENLNEENDGYLAFRLSINGIFDDYRDNAVRGKGIDFGIDRSGKLFAGKWQPSIETSQNQVLEGRLTLMKIGDKMKLSLYEVTDLQSPIDELDIIDTLRLIPGGLALVSHMENNENTPSLSFGDLMIQGEGIIERENQAYGPVLFNQYTLDRNRLKYTAQLAPMGVEDDSLVYFQTMNSEGIWEAKAESPIDPMARTATFVIDNWDKTADVLYRVEYAYQSYGDKSEREFFGGTIRHDPVEKEELVIAGFTGNNDLGFPNKDLTDNVVKQNPDLLFFSGDQIYEGVGGYGVQRGPLQKSTLDYLRKWYIFGWTYKDLLRDIPSVSMTDDHDVYHGNIWGAGGIATPDGLRGNAAQDAGGYKMPAEWVNMVQRTQTSHLPDPYDPSPVSQGIGVYYTDMVYGNISFAILEDRKFKSAPGSLLPDAEIDNGWAQNREWDPVKEGDAIGAELLGERQEEFLTNWVSDWSDHAEMKVVLSQTIFANVATLPQSEYHDKIVPKLRILTEGEYPPDDRPVSDMDSNGWPQTSRDNALRILRKGFSFHIAGDQHLGSVIQYGIDEYRDAGYAFCVPSVSNIWPRRWYPQIPGINRLPNQPKYTGDFLDGFGNRISVEAISNPVFTGREPSNLYDRATGYGIVKINSGWRAITMECWPRDIDPTIEGAKQYPGWPVIVTQLQQYGREIKGRLSNFQVPGYANPVFDVISESNGELLYSFRSTEESFQPFVFEKGTYTVRVRVPESGLEKEYPNMQTGNDYTVFVKFN